VDAPGRLLWDGPFDLAQGKLRLSPRELNSPLLLPIDFQRANSAVTTEQYAASIVEKYHIEPDANSPSHRAVDEVIPLLKQWGKQYLLGITLSGAYAQNTAITLCSYADVLITLSPIPGMDMKKVFWNLFEFLTDHDLRPRTHNVSIQLQSKGLWVDLIPACRDKGSSGLALFNKKSGASVHTDLAQHIHLVGNSGRQQEISAVKIWRERCSLDFPSFYLELTVLHALEGERFGQVAENVRKVLRHLSGRFEQMAVHDPANSDNVVSNDLDAAGKQAIAKAARDALYDENWKKILW